MDHIILHVTYTCKPGKAEEFVRTVKDRGLQQTVRAEDGCLQYDYHISCEAPDTVVLLEMWRDAGAVAVHMGQPHMKEIGKLKEQLVLNTDIRRFE
ncbi:MAG: putative quinol monooxygenase [Candidatus Enterenecus sp.]